jgi:molecular chaperone DnaJ
MAAQREWLEKDYYRVLGVSDTASQKDIKSAYRKLSREYHPDANPGDTAAEERFKEVSAAYDVVGDAEKRKEYDEVRKLGPMGGMFGGAGGPSGPGAGGFRVDDIGDLGDVLGGLFGRRRNRAGGAGAGTGPHRGQDL